MELTPESKMEDLCGRLVTLENTPPGSVPDATTEVKGKVQLATDNEVSATKVPKANDPRLSDARTPTAHNHDAAYSAIGHTHNGLTPTGGTTGQVLKKASNTNYDYTWQADETGGAGSTPPWKGAVVACVADGDPQTMLGRILHNPLHATPTNIGVAVARVSYFRLDTAITVANVRFFGVGATTAVYHIAIYRDSDSVRMSGDLNPNTAAQAWGAAASSFTLAANVLYFVAVGIDTVGTTAGIACCSGTTGRIGVLPTDWPGSLDINAATPKITPFGFAQFAVTNGVMPATAPTRALQAAWTGGMPAIFLDSI